MHTVEWNGVARPVAATWNELGLPQLHALLPVLGGEYDDPGRRQLDALAVLLGANQAKLLRLTDVQLTQVLWLTDFLLQAPVGLTRQPLPVVRPPRHWPASYHGPTDELGTLSFLEFAFADAYFVAYANTQDAQWLNLLLGTLYRPQRRPYRPKAPDYDGDRRQAFNEHHIETHAGRLARLPMALKQLVLAYYRGCRHALEQQYPYVFTQAEEADARPHPDGWGYVLRELAGQAFGPYEQTGRQPVPVILAKLNDDLARAEQLRREQALNQQRP